MNLLSKVLYAAADGIVVFHCPACDHGHQVRVAGADAWGYNGNAEKPTFTPSILYRSHVWTPPVNTQNIEQWREQPWEQKKVEHICHSFVTDGQIQFLNDCTHSRAGMTLPLPEIQV